MFVRLVDSALQEILKALHLLLGCAIHCDAKEELVERMTHLPENVQLSIMEYIQQVDCSVFNPSVKVTGKGNTSVCQSSGQR